MASTPRRVVLFKAEGCHLCERAQGQLLRLREELGFEYEELLRLREELGFEYEEVDIGGVPELEERYRESLPVVEIDGERAFVYYVDEAGLRHKLRRS